MRVVSYQGPKNFRLDQRPDADLASGEARLQVEACGVCGTDVRIYKGEHSAYEHAAGRVPGHEIVGRIVEISADAQIDEVGTGDRVFVAPNIGCGSCVQCASGNENLCRRTEGIGITRDGAFADHLIVPSRAVERGNLIPLDSAIDPATGTLIEPLACVLRGQQKVRLGLGDSVYVAGGGPIGLLHIALAKASGASVIICSEPSEPRRQAAIRAGADHAIDPMAGDPAELVADLTGGAGIDVVITAAPIHAIQTSAIELAGTGGRVLFFGGLPKSRPTVEIDTNIIHYRELLVVGTTASTNQNCRDATALINAGVLSLDWMVSDIVALDDFTDAIDKVQDAAALKVVLAPTSDRKVPS
jgi:L-iditol 2-dehydrogenase